jgi:uroporphyrin-III C-methyltransferase/precorrin-2 dehydrogenase/sirohydrochlorin ferrochelatase
MVAGTAAPYLLALRLDGRRVLVTGGGAVATRRVAGLLDARADVLVVSPQISASLHDLAAAGRIRWQSREYAPGDCAGAWLVCACTDDPAVNAAVAQEAEAARIWSRRDAAAPPPTASGQAGTRFGVSGKSACGHPDERPPLSGRVAPPPPPGGAPGRRGPVTPACHGPGRAKAADVVVADRLAPRPLLDELAPDVELVDAAKIPRGRAMAQEEINSVLVERARRGLFVVRLKGGDPFVFGRGGEEILACLEAGIPVTVVPGVTSAVAVPAAAGIPLTHRGITQEFRVVSAHIPPGDERSTVNWAELGGSQATLVLLMALEKLEPITRTLMRYGRDSRTPVSVIVDGTLPTQHIITTGLATVAEEVGAAGLRPPAIVVIGEVVNVGAQIAEVSRKALREAQSVVVPVFRACRVIPTREGQ